MLKCCWRRRSKSGRSAIRRPSIGPSIAWPTMNGWFSRRPMAFGSSSGGWKSADATCGRSGHLQTRGDRSHDRRGPRRVSPPRRSRAGFLSLGGARAGPGPCRQLAAKFCSRAPIAVGRCSRTNSNNLAEVDQVAVYHNADVASLPEYDRRANHGRHGRLDHADQLGDHRAIACAACPSQPGGGSDSEIRLASLSPITSATAARLGWSVAVEATEFTWDGLVHALTCRRLPPIAEEHEPHASAGPCD